MSTFAHWKKTIKMNSMDRIKGIVYACISAATFGMIPLFVNTSIQDGINNDTILVYRYTIAAAVYGIYLLFRHTDFSIPRGTLKELLWAGVGGYGITAFFLFLSYHYMPTGIATSIHYLYPVVVALFMSLFYKERLSLLVKCGITLAIVGVAFLSWTEGKVEWLGLVFVVLSTITYGTYIVALNRPRLKAMNPDVLTFWVLTFSALFYLLMAGGRGTLEWVTTPRFLTDVTLLAVLSTIVSARLLVSAVKMIGSVTSSVLGTLEPITAIIIGIFYFHEQFRFWNVLGFMMVICAVLVVIVYMPSGESPGKKEEGEKVD